MSKPALPNRKENLKLIPQGAFIMGTDIEAFYGTALANSEHAKLDEAPMHVRFLEAYRIEQYPGNKRRIRCVRTGNEASATPTLEKRRLRT